MKKPPVDIMWQAISTNDPTYDGEFFYAVRTTKVVCRPSCKSKLPCRENVEFFANVDEAIACGYRPCKRCRPDIGAEYQPVRELVDRACLLVQSGLTERELLHQLPDKLGVSRFYFSRLFKARTGSTPQEYLRRQRVEMAKELLAQGMSSATAGYTAGFASLSGFYSAFRAITGTTPQAYRRSLPQEER